MTTDDFKLPYFTITQLEKFARCPRHHFYQTQKGFRRVGAQNLAMFYGTCIHKALGAMLSTKSYDQGVIAFDEAWSDVTPTDEIRTPAMARLVLYSFYASWFPSGLDGIFEALPPPMTNVKIRLSERVSDWEIPWAIDVGLPIPLAGRADGWCRNRQTGDIWILEFKTSREMTDRFLTGFTANPQIVGYPFALKQFSDLPIKGTLLVGLQTAKTSQAIMMKQFETMKHEEDDFLYWVRECGSRILSYEKSGHWPKWRSGCTTYAMFGQPGYMCPYAELCSVPDYRSIQHYYEVERHQPYLVNVDDDEPAQSSYPTPGKPQPQEVFDIDLTQIPRRQ